MRSHSLITLWFVTYFLSKSIIMYFIVIFWPHKDVDQWLTHVNEEKSAGTASVCTEVATSVGLQGSHMVKQLHTVTRVALITVVIIHGKSCVKYTTIFWHWLVSFNWANQAVTTVSGLTGSPKVTQTRSQMAYITWANQQVYYLHKQLQNRIYRTGLNLTETPSTLLNG